MFKNKIITAAISLATSLLTFSANAANIGSNINSSTLVSGSDNNFTGNFTVSHDSASLITIGSLTTNTTNEGIISMNAGAGALDITNIGTSSNKLNSIVFAVGSGELDVRGDLYTVGAVSSGTNNTGRLSVLGSSAQLISASTIGNSTALESLSTSGVGTKDFSTSGRINVVALNTAATTILGAGTINTVTTLTATAATTLNAALSNTVTNIDASVDANIVMIAGTSNTVNTVNSNASLIMSAATFNTITTLNANGVTHISGDTNTITNANINANTIVTASTNTFTTVVIASSKTLTINSNGGALAITSLSGAVDDSSKLVLNSASDVTLDISTGGATLGTASNRLNFTTGGAGLKTIVDSTELDLFNVGSNAKLTGATNNIASTSISDGKTLNIDGAAANLSGISIVVNDPDTVSSPITVTSAGTVVVTDGSTVNFDVTSLTDTTTLYNLIDASTSSAGTPLTVNISTLLITDNSTLLNFTLTRVGNILKYNGALDSSVLPVDDVAAVSTLLDISSDDPTLLAARAELVKITDQATLQQAAKDLQKERNGSLANESINATYISRNILNSRIYEVVNSVAGFASGDSKNLGVAAGSSADQESGMWGQVYGGASKYRKDNEGYNSSTGGVMLGLDTKGPSIFGKKFESLYGVALSYSKTDIDNKDVNDQRTNIDSYYLALYNSNFAESGLGLYNNNALHSTYHAYDAKRSIVIGSFATTATADFSGLQLGATSEFGYGFKIAEKLLISPNVGLSYAFLKQEDYQEKGAGGIGLKVDNNNIHSLVSTLGVKAASKFNAGIYCFIPQLSTVWIHNIKNNGQGSTSSFIAGGSSFRSNSADLPENLVDFGLILTAFKSKNAESDISVRYDMTLGSGFTTHTGYLQYRNLF